MCWIVLINIIIVINELRGFGVILYLLSRKIYRASAHSLEMKERQYTSGNSLSQSQY